MPCAGSPGRPGISSKHSSVMRTTGFRPTITRKIPTAASPTELRRPTRDCFSSQPWPRTTWATSACGTLVKRLERTFDTLEQMEKHWGHFYNWYDTRTLQPLPPAYISTVDSGNFLACLVALKQGLQREASRADARAPPWQPAWPIRCG